MLFPLFVIPLLELVVYSYFGIQMTLKFTWCSKSLKKVLHSSELQTFYLKNKL